MNSGQKNKNFWNNERTWRHTRLLIELFLACNMFGIFFMFASTLETPSYKDAISDEIIQYPFFNAPNIIAYLIPWIRDGGRVGIDGVAPNPQALTILKAFSWTSIILMGCGWILWEFASSKSGNLKMVILAIIIFTIQMALALNLLSLIGLCLAIILMIAYSCMSKIPIKSNKKISLLVKENQTKNYQKNKNFLKKLNFKNK